MGFLKTLCNFPTSRHFEAQLPSRLCHALTESGIVDIHLYTNLVHESTAPSMNGMITESPEHILDFFLAFCFSPGHLARFFHLVFETGRNCNC
jgi:hypothetical protein